MWDVAEGTCTSVLEGQAVRWASCVADGKRLLCASGDRTTNLWDLASATATAALPGTKGSRVKSFAASQVNPLRQAPMAGEPTAPPA